MPNMKLNTLYTSLLMMVLLMGCSAENSQKPEPAVESTEKQAVATPDSSLRILFLGDSITAGFGLGEDLAFPALLQAQITESGYSAKVSNAGISGDTSTGGLARTDWLLQSKVDILVLELGGNDGLRGIDLSLTRSNLRGIVEKTQMAWPDVRIIMVGMIIPPNLGHEYTRGFSAMYPEIATSLGTGFFPFTPENLEGILDNMQPDGIHPTEEGHRIIAATLWKTLEPVVQDLS